MKFAIVISTYQRPDGNTFGLLKRALESIYNQTYQNYKVFLIGDDYKNKNEFNSFASIIPKDKIYLENLPIALERTKYPYPSDELWCSGGCNAINHGIDKALENGFRYVALLDHDDFWHPEHLERFSEVLSLANPSIIFTKGIYENLPFPNIKYLQFKKTHINPDSYYELPSKVKAYPLLPYHSSFVKSSVCLDLQQVGLRFRDMFEVTGQPSPSDGDLWMRIRGLILEQKIQHGIFVDSLTVSNTEEGYSKTKIINEKENTLYN